MTLTLVNFGLSPTEYKSYCQFVANSLPQVRVGWLDAETPGIMVATGPAHKEILAAAEKAGKVWSKIHPKGL